MKKFLTVLLAAVMLLTAVMPAAALGENYTAALSPARQNASLGETVTVEVSIAGGAAYNAADLTLSYNAEKLEFDEAASSVPGNPRITDENGSLRIRLYGGKNALDTAFKLAFRVKSAEGEATVTLVSARVDKGENASLQNAPEARVTNANAVLVCQPEKVKVTLSEWFEGEDYALKGKTYEFKAKDKNYLYTFTDSTMNGTAAPIIKDDEQGIFRIPDVTGDIVIAAERTPKKFRVAFTGSARPDLSGASEATYLTDYTFTLVRDSRYEYGQPRIYIDNKRFTGYSASGDSYTIPGKAITGKVLISVEKSLPYEAETTLVRFVGSGAGAASGAAGAVIGEDYTFTVTKASGYDYTITATMSGQAVTVYDNGNGTYTIRSVSGPLEIRIERTAQMTVGVYQYMRLRDARNIYMVMVEAPVTAGEAYTYEGNVMYRSEKYGAYVYLVATQEGIAKFRQQIPQKLGMAAADAPKVNYENGQGGEALRALYNDGADFDPQQMAKYLAADLNGTRCVDIMDAVMAVYRGRK